MKTDISIPNPIYQAAEKLAKELGISLSELYTAALTAYISEHEKKTSPKNPILFMQPSLPRQSLNWSKCKLLPNSMPGMPPVMRRWKTLKKDWKSYKARRYCSCQSAANCRWRWS
jgi:hypothetical protein